jgi:mono/diheme cytochrome c family protein
MAVSPHYKHTIAYLAALGGIVSFATYTIAADELFPPGLDGRQLWFIDMMDADFVRAYEEPMRQLPEGVVSRNMYSGDYDRTSRTTDEGKALTHSYEVNEDLLATGQWNYETYCTPCHADGLGSGLVTNNSNGRRVPVPGAVLVGDAGVMKNYTDGYVYLTIREGSAVMPGYSWAMSDEEMWSIVEYLRTQPGGAYVPPKPAAALDAPTGTTEEG